MLQRDYLLELMSNFVESISKALLSAHAVKDPSLALEDAHAIEQDIAGLLDMDPSVALSLSPDSLVTMLVLSGLGETLAEYIVFALMRLADIYEQAGDSDTADFRRQQAAAIAESFGTDTSQIPEALKALVAELDK